MSVPSHYQYWLQFIDIHPRAISQNISKIWWQFFMHLSMVYELISKPCTSWVSVSLPMFAKSHAWLSSWAAKPGVCFTNVSRALQDILLKFVYCRNRSSYENFKLKLCTCAQSIGHTYKVSVWNSHHQCEFQYCVFSRDYFGYEKYSLHLIFTFYLNRDTSVLELFPVVAFR